MDVTTCKKRFESISWGADFSVVLVDESPEIDRDKINGFWYYVGYTDDFLPREVQAEIILSGALPGLFKEGKTYIAICKEEYKR